MTLVAVLVRGDFLSVRDVAGLLEKRYGEAPRLENKGTLDELRAACDVALQGDPLSMSNQPL